MSARGFLTATNIVLIIAGIYFIAIAASQEGSLYTIVGTLLCFIAVGLSLKNDLFLSGPWRLATSAFVLTVLTAQLLSNAYSLYSTSLIAVASSLLNGALLILFLGVLLSTAKETIGIGTDQDEERTPEGERHRKEPKKLTYEI